MYRKFSLSIVATSSLLVIPFLGLTSCDSGPVNTGGSSNFELGTRFDLAELTADSNAIAVMPTFLLQGDSFTHNVPFILDPNVSEYDRGFQAADPPIIVDSSGQISNAEGESTTNNVNYIYDGVNAFDISEQNSFIATAGEALRGQFEEVTQNIVAASNEDQDNSFANLVLNNQSNANASRVYRVGLEGAGIIGSEAGIVLSTDFFTGTNSNVTQLNVRTNRRIVYEPDSTNATLMATGQISGNVTIIDTYANTSILDEDGGRGFLLGLQPEFAVFQSPTSNLVVDHDGIVGSTISHQGRFTLTLGVDAF